LSEEAGAYKNLSGKDDLEFMAGFYAHNNEKKKEIINKGNKAGKAWRKDSRQSIYL